MGAVTLQFSFGLLLLSVLAPTSLAEERTRGTLDVLMTTPLSAGEIAWGKWLGTYRTVFLLTILPTIGAAVIGYQAPRIASTFLTAAMRARYTIPPLTALDRVVGSALVVCEMLSYGAAITSVGLALATWISRLGRAVAINVFLFVFLGIGWPLFFELIVWRMVQQRLWTSWGVPVYSLGWISSGMMAISPFAAPQITLYPLIYFWGFDRTPVWCFAFAWTVLAWVLAGLVFWATRETFDRNLGRIPETPG